MTLARSVEKLTGPYTVEHHQRMVGGGRRLVTTTHPSLISMLRNASLSSGGAHAGSATPTTRNVVDADAIELLAKLRTDIRAQWTALTPGLVAAGILTHHDTLEESLASWYVLFRVYDRARMVPPEQFNIAADVCEKWVRTIEAKFDPISTRPIPYPCPTCHERWIVTGAGILATRVSTLLLTVTATEADWNVTCRACSATWTGKAELHRLNNAIDRTR